MSQKIVVGIEDFGAREHAMAAKLLSLYADRKMSILASEYFYEEKVTVQMNRNSGFVFLCNEEYQTLMENDGELDLFLSTPYEGREGFYDELMDEYDDMHEEDKEFMDQYTKTIEKRTVV